MAIDRLNLIPKEMQTTARKRVSTEQMIYFGIVAALSCLSYLGFNQYRNLQKTQLEFQNLSSEITVLKSQIASVEAAEKEKSRKEEKFNIVQELLGSKVVWSEVFKELSLITPSDVWLVNLTSNHDGSARRVNIVGETSSQIRVSDFFSALESSYNFRNVLFKYSEQLEGVYPPLYRFEFECEIPELGERQISQNKSVGKKATGDGKDVKN